MTIELWMLAASIVLGMIHLIASSHLITRAALSTGGRLKANSYQLSAIPITN
jgi:hypothetical protein